jgi:hypothetical protein
MKVCIVEGCELKVKAQGYCNSHYMQFWRTGEVKLKDKFATEHPLYQRWSKMRSNKSLSEEWLDFWTFAKDVGEQPEDAKKIYKLDKDRLYGKDNFRWSKPLIGDRKNEYYRKYWKTSLVYRNSKYIKAYGITLHEYERMLKEQDCKCAICRREETRVVRNGSDEAKRMLAVDHCHKTGKVRGLLCSDCNPSLGGFQDSIEILANAIAYLNKYQS